MLPEDRNEGCILYSSPKSIMGAIDTSRFLRVYDNIPINVRKELVAIVDGKPISWDVAYKEITNDTPLGNKIFKVLVKMKFI